MIQDLWYRDTIIYNLDLETFLDADGDGVGDFEGLMRQLDYLNALGIETIWLAPFQPTPNRDNGYDIRDYYGVDPRHGSAGDFVEFMHAAGKRGIKVIIDLVVNHTSDQHPWFQAARSDPESRYRDWYIWSEEDPPGAEKNAFSQEAGSAWSYDAEAGAHYFHRFYDFQPDLNIDNPDVRTEIQRIMGYWLQLNVHGFRVDAVPFLIESSSTEEEISRQFHYLHVMRDFVQWRRGNAILLGEVNVAPEEADRYFGTDDEVLHMVFNFHVNQHLFYALATGKIDTLKEALRKTKKIPPTAQWANFLRNHDELDLNQLSEEQRQQVFAAFGPEETMQVYGDGIRRRLAPMLGDRARIEMAHSLLFSLPGTPVLYYGDEIGMGDDLSLDGRSAVRTPMQWADEPQAAFSRAEKLVRPVIDEGPYAYQRVNVQSQRRDPGSLLNWMADMIRLRKECPEIGWGDWRIIDVANEGVLVMRYDWQDTSVLVVHNFLDQQQEIRLDPGVAAADTLMDLRMDRHSRADGAGNHHLTLKPYGYQWYRVGGLGSLLGRQRA